MRRRKAEVRVIAPDARYGSELIQKFINMVMYEGKKALATNIVYDAIDGLKGKVEEEDLQKAFMKILDNARPRMILKARRIGGATYQVPTEVTREKGLMIALRWLRDSARARKGKPMQEKLAEELLSAYKGEGSVIKKRDDTHKMAEANRAFAHFK